MQQRTGRVSLETDPEISGNLDMTVSMKGAGLVTHMKKA